LDCEKVADEKIFGLKSSHQKEVEELQRAIHELEVALQRSIEEARLLQGSKAPSESETPSESRTPKSGLFESPRQQPFNSPFATPRYSPLSLFSPTKPVNDHKLRLFPATETEKSSGEKGRAQFLTWVEEYQEYCKARRMTEEQKATVLATHLVGRMSRIHNETASESANLETTLTRIEEIAYCERDVLELKANMEAITWASEKDLDIYLERKKKAIALAGVKDPVEIASLLLNGMKSTLSELAWEILTNHFNVARREAKTKANFLEEFQLLLRKQKAKETTDINAIEARSCHSCGVVGHLQKDCPEERRKADIDKRRNQERARREKEFEEIKKAEEEKRDRERKQKLENQKRQDEEEQQAREQKLRDEERRRLREYEWRENEERRRREDARRNDRREDRRNDRGHSNQPFVPNEQRKCYNCNGYGHIGKDCPSPDTRKQPRRDSNRK
jgi:hypothetical protein